MNGTLRDDLIAARALIDTPEKWGKDAYLLDGCLCALGAARKAYFGRVWGGCWDDGGRVYCGDDNPVADALARALTTDTSVAEFNDDPSTTHSDIMALFDRAIAAAEAGK